MRAFIRRILLLINILAAAALVASYFSVYVSPASAWLFAFISLAYPFLLLFNIFFIIWWLVFRKWYFLISVFCIALGWNALRSTFQINLTSPPKIEDKNEIRVMTYNVRLFNYYQWTRDTSAWQRIADYIKEVNPDMVCFQEFVTIPRSHHDLISLKQKMGRLLYSHVYYTDNIPGKINFGIATFSKHPIINKKMIKFEKSINGSISSDIVIRGDTVRIINCHLQSIRLRKDYNDLIDSLLFNYSDRQLNEIKDISMRLRQAYIRRANQVDILAGEIKASPYPVILCGDFNDTPVSYTYRTVSRNMNDAFTESGSGSGSTFRGKFPYGRIDYVLFSPDFTSVSYHTGKEQWSDHYPVLVRLKLNEKAVGSDPRSRPK